MNANENRWLALYVLCAGVLMIVLDATIVNVALPTIKEDLGFSQSELAWVVNAYLIAFGGLLLLSGRIGDLIGHRKIFLIGLGVFTVASLACGLAQSQEMLIVARFIQGAGGALASAVVLGMIVTMFPEPRDQAKAIGMYAFVASAGGSIGLLAGGVLTQALSWHFIFLVNVPIGIATVAGALRLLPADKGIGFRAGADLPGAALVTGALMLGVYTIVEPAAARAAADFPLARRHGREPRAGPACRRHVRRLLPRRALPAARPRLRRARDRAGVPALDARHGAALRPLHRAADQPVRRVPDAAARRGAYRRGPGVVRARAARRRLPRRRAADDAPARRRRRPVLPGAHDARHVGRHAGGCGPRLGPRQHLGPGRRCRRARRAR